MKKFTLLLTFAFNISGLAFAQDITGKWVTIDDNSGKKRSVVEITKKGDTYFGSIIEMYLEPHEDPNAVCDLCTDDRKNKKIMGLQIIRDMKRDGKEYNSGEILDPENGKVYRCKLWVENSKLMVRGYIAIFYRTQEWLRFEE